MNEPTVEELQQQIGDLKRQHTEALHDYKQRVIDGRHQREELEMQVKELNALLTDARQKLAAAGLS